MTAFAPSVFSADDNALHRKIPLAFSANLDQGKAIHARTFRRAVEDALAWMPDLSRYIAPVWINDQASFDGGQRASQLALRARCRAVVGHFASAAADGAIPATLATGLPVFLPAATADHLTQQGGPIYRLCNPDHTLAKHLVDRCTQKNHSVLLIGGDDSLHARYLGESLIQIAKQTASLHIKLAGEEEIFAVQSTRNNAVAYIGSFENTVHFCQRFHARQCPLPLLLTDDAVHPDLALRIDKNLWPKIEVFGFAPAEKILADPAPLVNYLKRWHSPPGTYYCETFAATQLAVHLAFEEATPNIPPIQTVLGEMTLTKNELSRAPHARWHLSESGLHMCELLPNNAPAVST